LKTLKVGGVLPMIDSPLGGTAQNPTGTVELILATSDHDGRFSITGEPVSYSGGGHLTVTAPLRHENTPREPIAVTTTTPNPDTQGSPALDVPVTLVVELGRVNLTLSRLAELKSGDVVELGRHSREPIELTSGGRLVARGELVQIDTELGVRVLQVFL
jgi:flagellar motor switch protein FliN